MALLTSRTLSTGVTGTDLIHIVITGDTSQNPAGSSYKANIDQVKDYLSSYFVNSTGNTSASCITDLYVTNVYGCSPITIHDSVQSVGSSSTGNTSFAFGGGVSAFGDYSHSEGDTTTSLGSGSHAEGASTYTGLFGYNSTSIVSGVITLDSSYGDVTSQFSSFIILDDSLFDGIYGIFIFYINSITFDGTNTIITLTDASVNTTQAHIGSDLYIIPTSSDVYVGGYNSHSEGDSNASVGYASHTEGKENFSYGSSSHSEGVQTKSFGDGSHSEGRNTTSNGLYSHVEGTNTISEGIYSHAEGEGCQSVGEASHSEGRNTISEGTHSHAEGLGTTSTGNNSHSEGNTTNSIGNSSHSEGSGTKSDGDYSHAEGEGCQSLGASSHAEGNSTLSIADYSHSEGYDSSTGQRGYYSSSIVSGVITLDASYGDVSSVFISDVVLDDFLYDNSYSVKVFSFSSVIFDGTNTIITLNDLSVSTTQARIGVLGVISPTGSSLSVGGYYSHAEGRQTISLGPYSHAQGVDNVSIGIGSFSSGRESYSYGEYSFVHSNNSKVYGDRSVVLGGSGITGNTDDTVYVPYLNIRDLATGTSVNNLGVDSQGNVVIGSGSGTLTPPVTLSGSGITVLTLIGSGNTVPVFEIQGSSGQLFKVNDSLIGSLFSVNNISALPVFEVFSDNTILMGDYNSPSLNTTVKLSASTGSTVVYSIPTSAYTGAFFEYTVGSGTNFRAGNITSIWDGSNAQFVDSYTGGGSPEIGSTSDISFSVGINSGNAELLSSATTTNWDVKVIVRSI